MGQKIGLSYTRAFCQHFAMQTGPTTLARRPSRSHLPPPAVLTMGSGNIGTIHPAAPAFARADS